MEQTNRPGGKPNQEKRDRTKGESTRESRRDLNRPVKFISNRLILFRRSNFPLRLPFRRVAINAVSYAIPIFHSPRPKSSSPVSRDGARYKSSLSLSLRPRIVSMRFRCANSPSPRFVPSFSLFFLPPFGRKMLLSAPLREDINRRILNRFEERVSPARKKRRNLLSPFFLSPVLSRDDTQPLSSSTFAGEKWPGSPPAFKSNQSVARIDHSNELITILSSFRRTIVAIAL